MTVKAGAPSRRAQNWNRINWQTVQAQVYRMQMRIAKSVREGRWGRAQALQRLLSRSFYGRLVAVRRIMRNKGSRTPGIDGATWKSAGQRWLAACNLKVSGYRAQPLKRKYLLKKNGQKRPLGIPTLHDRAMQELFALGLRPIAETTADQHSYGFREKRSLHDAIKMTFIALSQKVSAQWILEADIKACFDRIDHDWLLANIPLPRAILRQWLKAGYMESSTLYPTDEGTPQGGIISPILCNMCLDGLQAVVLKGRNKKRCKLNVIRYADDFIITGASAELLQQEIRPDLDRYLAARGLTLSASKTRLRHVSDGVEFLGFDVRKFGDRLMIRPADGKPRALLLKVKACLQRYRGAPFHVLLLKLNRVLRGWAHAYRRVVAKTRMSYIDGQVFYLVQQWLHQEHPSKSWAWIARRYRRRINGRVDFCAVYRRCGNDIRGVRLFRTSDLPIRYHIKIRGDATPYDPAYNVYFAQRDANRKLVALADRIHLNTSSWQKLVA